MGAEKSRTRKALIAGAVAVALTGAGTALAWSADPPTPSPSPSQSASPSAPGQDGRQAKPDRSQRPQFQHGESVVKKADGTFQTVLEQRGTVETVSSTSITVKSEDGFTQEYAVTADTRISSVPAASGGSGSGTGSTDDGGKRSRSADGTISDIATGDAVRITGVKDGGTATAQRIVEGTGDHPGLGRGHGHGRGHGRGPGRSQGSSSAPVTGA